MSSDSILRTDILSVDEVRQLYALGDSAHDFDHVLRVVKLAHHLAQMEGADATVVRCAALLHDVPVPANNGENSDSDSSDGDSSDNDSSDNDVADASAGRRDHHMAAAEFAEQLLTERGLGTDAVANVVHCIEAHRFRDRTIQPETIEAQCLYDADKLDSIGAIGIARAFAYAGAHNNRLWTTPLDRIPAVEEQPDGADYTPVHEYVYKLGRILDSLYTPSARRIGEGRHAFMCEYFGVLEDEVLGER